MKTSKGAALRKLAALYATMDQSYSASAQAIGLSCAHCPDCCCESFFQHHTRLEWAYLWEGVRALPQSRQQELTQAAGEWIRQFQAFASQGLRPRLLCPLGQREDGFVRCALYAYRPMTCRLHGVPNVLTRPDGQRAAYPGCDRAQDLGKTCEPVLLDRTPLLTALARLELELVGQDRMRRLPRVDLTIAEMLVNGPPQF